MRFDITRSATGGRSKTSPRKPIRAIGAMVASGATAGAALAELRALCERELAARGGPLPPPEQRGDRRSQNKRKAGAREP